MLRLDNFAGQVVARLCQGECVDLSSRAQRRIYYPPIAICEVLQSVKQYFVYMMASRSRRTYIGLTSNLEARVYQHKTRAFEGHTALYNINQLVFIEEFANVDDAIARERELKGLSRAKKLALIEQHNPEWDDLSEAWFL